MAAFTTAVVIASAGEVSISPGATISFDQSLPLELHAAVAVKMEKHGARLVKRKTRR